jgi:cell division protein FtsB
MPSRRRRGAIAPIQRVRWDRVGRVCLLLVLAAVVGLYVEHTISFFATRGQAQRAEAYVRELEQSNARLEAEQRALRQPATIAAAARRLGMVRAGEQPYVVSGLPGG